MATIKSDLKGITVLSDLGMEIYSDKGFTASNKALPSSVKTKSTALLYILKPAFRKIAAKGFTISDPEDAYSLRDYYHRWSQPVPILAAVILNNQFFDGRLTITYGLTDGLVIDGKRINQSSIRDVFIELLWIATVEERVKLADEQAVKAALKGLNTTKYLDREFRLVKRTAYLLPQFAPDGEVISFLQITDAPQLMVSSHDTEEEAKKHARVSGPAYDAISITTDYAYGLPDGVTIGRVTNKLRERRPPIVKMDGLANELETVATDYAKVGMTSAALAVNSAAFVLRNQPIGGSIHPKMAAMMRHGGRGHFYPPFNGDW